MSFQISQIKNHFPLEKLKNDNQNLQQNEQLKKVCADFESIFISQLLKNMRSSVEESNLFGNVTGSDIYQNLFDTEISKKIAHGGGLGLADILYRSLSSRLSKVESAQEPSQIKVESKPLQQLRQFNGSLFDRIGKYHNLISKAGKKFSLPLHLIYGVIAQESAGNPQVVSRAGAKGLMQLMDETAGEVGVKNPFNPQENIFGGVAYLKKQLMRFNHNVELALAAYNAGPSAVEKYGGVPPYRETQEYVKKVMRYAQEFEPLLRPRSEAI